MRQTEDNGNLLTALEAAVAECRRLQARIIDLEERLEYRQKVKETVKDIYNPPKRRKKSNRTYRPWQKEEEQQPEVKIEVAHRRSVDDIYREQKQKHEAKVAREAAVALEQERLADEAYEASEKNKQPVDVRISEAKKQLLVEAGKVAMKQTGN